MTSPSTRRPSAIPLEVRVSVRPGSIASVPHLVRTAELVEVALNRWLADTLAIEVARVEPREAGYERVHPLPPLGAVRDEQERRRDWSP